MDMAEINKLLQQQGEEWTAFKAANDQSIKELKAGNTARAEELQQEVKRIDDALNRTEELKSALQEFESDFNKKFLEGVDESAKENKAGLVVFNNFRKSYLGNNATDMDLDAYVAYKKAFDKALRKATLTPDEQKAMQAGIDTDGGFFLPPPTVGRTVKRIYERSPIRQLVTVQQISTEALEGLEDLDEAGSGGWVGETQVRSETSTPQIGKWRIVAHEIYAQPKVTQKLLDDAAVDVEAWLADKVADKLQRVEDLAFLTGDGIAKPRGLLDYPTSATGDATRPWGTFEHILSGSSGALGSNVDKFLELIGAFKPAYLQRAKWLTNRGVITSIRKMKDGQNLYLWQPSLQAGQPDILLGYPVVTSQDMPAVASDSVSVAFGDFAEAYTIVDRIGLRTLRDPYTDKPFIKFYTTRRVGGGAVNFEAVKFLKMTT